MQLHRKYAADGLVVMSLDVMQEEWEQKEEVLAFLTEQKATFPNYILKDTQEKVDQWLDRNEVFATPAMIAFDRSGNRVPVPDFKTTTDEELFVKKLLGK